MKRDEVKVGGLYLAKVSGKVTTVRLDAIREITKLSSSRDYDGKAKYRDGEMFDVTNITTGRKTTFRSAAKFRSEVRGMKAVGNKLVPDGPQSPPADGIAKEIIQIAVGSKVEFVGPAYAGGSPIIGAIGEVTERKGNFSQKAGGPKVELVTVRFEGMARQQVIGLPRIRLRAEGDQKCSDPISASTVKTPSSIQMTQTDRPIADTAGAPSLGESGQSGTDSEGDEQRPDPIKNTIAAQTESQSAATGTNGDSGFGLASQLEQASRPMETYAAGNLVAGMMPNEEQAAILSEVIKSGLKVLVINAGAGCGKTAVLRMIEAVLPGIGQYTAFNSSLVEESSSKFVRASCKTTHALAFGEVGRHYAHRLKSGRMKSYQIAGFLGIENQSVIVPGLVDFSGNPKPKMLAADFLAGQVIVAVKKFCQSADRVISVNHFNYIDGIDIGEPREDGSRKRGYDNNNVIKAYLLSFATRAWADLSATDGQLPFFHDAYVKVWQLGEGDKRPTISANYILLDEHQDTSPVFVDVLRQQRHALVILVGDSNQIIYAWRGAMDASKAFPDAPHCNLGQSYRFGQIIADVANSILKRLEEPTDLVMRGAPGIPSMVCEVERPRCYLYRTNAGAVSRLMREIAESRRPHLIGGSKEMVEWCEAAISLQAGRPTRHQELACFGDWKEVVAYSKTDEGEDLKLMVKLIEEFKAEKIRDALKNMPDEEHADCVISTAHKCIHPDTLVETDCGLMPIRFIPDSGLIATPGGTKVYSEKFTKEAGTVLALTTERGYELKLTAEHGITVWRNGSLDRVEAQRLVPGDWVRVRLGSVVEQTYSPPLPKESPGDIREQSYKIPVEMTDELAEFLGLMVADGVLIKNSGRPAGVRLGKRYPSVVNRFAELAKILFNYDASIGDMEGGTFAEVRSTFIGRWLDGFDGIQPHSKRVPMEILMATVQMQSRFLRGLFEDGTVNIKSGMVDHICWNNMDFDVVGVIQTMLLRQGIVSSRRWAHGIGWLYIYSRHARTFSERIGFVADEKNAKLGSSEFGEDTHCLIPLTRGELHPLEIGMTPSQKQNARYRGYISRNVAEQVITKLGPERAQSLIERMTWSYERIKSVDTVDESETMCITVTDRSKFLQNGFDAWNSKGREWESVKLGPDFPTLNRMGDSDIKLLYVAATRAKYMLDVSSCPPFCGGNGRSINSESSTEANWIPGLKVTYMVPMPAKQELDDWLAKRGAGKITQTSSTIAVPTTIPQAPLTMQPVLQSPLEGSGAGDMKGQTPTRFTWITFSGGWRARGPKNARLGSLVQVFRKDGSSSPATLASVIREFPEATIYGV